MQRLVCPTYNGTLENIFRFYKKLAEWYLEKKKLWTKNLEYFFGLCHHTPPTTHECPQENSAHSVKRLVGHREHIYEYFITFIRGTLLKQKNDFTFLIRLRFQGYRCKSDIAISAMVVICNNANMQNFLF